MKLLARVGYPTEWLRRTENEMFTITLTEEQKTQIKGFAERAASIETSMESRKNSGDTESTNTLEVELNLLVEELDTLLLECVEHVLKTFDEIAENTPLYNEDGSKNVKFDYLNSYRAAARMMQFTIRLTPQYGYGMYCISQTINNIPFGW